MQTVESYHKNTIKSRFYLIATTFLSLGCLLFTLPGQAQQNVLDQPITLRLARVSLVEALSAVGKQAGVTISYSSSQLNTRRTVSLAADKLPLSQVLADLLGEDFNKLLVEGRRITVQASQGKGTITGTVNTSDGQPAGFVTVGIRGQRSTQADEQGRFSLENIEAGVHTITASYVGLQTQQQRVTVTPGSTANVPFVLSEDARTLQEVVVNGERINKFAEKETEYVARMPLSNLENPQVYSTVNKELITQQITTDYGQALRNVPGVVPSVAGSAGYTNIVVRGFNTTGTLYNGMETQMYAGDPVNIERIEVIKGPSATLFGNASVSYGGVMNRVTKKPFEEAGGSVEYTLGSYSLSRLAFDYNTPLNTSGTALFRINGALNRQNSFQDYGYNRNYVIAPSLLLKPSERLTLSFDAEISYATRVNPFFPGFPSSFSGQGFKYLKLDYDRSLTGNDFVTKQGRNSFFANIRYSLSSNWTSSTNIGYSSNQWDQHYLLWADWLTQDSIMRSVISQGPRDFYNLQFQQNFNGDFKIGKVRNRVLVGIDAYHTLYKGTAYGDVIYDTVDVSKPGYGPAISLMKVNTMLAHGGIGAGQYTNQNSYALYASDVVDVTDQLNLMVSLRVNRFENKPNVINGEKGTNDYNQTSFSPKFGVVYRPIQDKVAIFANYMNGYSNVSPSIQPDGSVTTFKPEYANQAEGGIKLDLLQNRLSATASYYHITVDNVVRMDPETRFTLQDGTRRSKGVELELIANPVSGLNLVAGYSYNDSKYIKAQANVEGLRPVKVPENVANFWISYQLMETWGQGLGLGIGVNYIDEAFWTNTTTNTFMLPSYTLVNATLFFDRPSYRFGVKMDNIADQKYWDAWQGYARPGRTIAATVAYKF